MINRDCAALAAIVCVSSPVCGGVIAFTNVAPGDTYQTGVGQTISGAGSSVGLSMWANSFVADASGPVSQIRLPMGRVEGTNEFTLTLFTDVFGTLGVSLGSWTVTDEMGVFGSEYPLITVPTPGGGSLVAGTQYWLLAEGAFDTYAAWNRATGDPIGPVAVGGDDGFEYSDGILAAFEVTVVPAPAPFVALAAAGMLGAARRRRPGVRA